MTNKNRNRHVRPRARPTRRRQTSYAYNNDWDYGNRYQYEQEVYPDPEAIDTYNPYNGKSKLILIVLNTVLGPTGAARYYMGCHVSALIMFLTLVIAAVALYTGHTTIGVILLGINTLWGLFDFVVILYNTLTLETNAPYTFCRENGEKWTSPSDNYTGRVAGIVSAIYFAFSTYVYASVLTTASTSSQPPARVTDSPN